MLLLISQFIVDTQVVVQPVPEVVVVVVVQLVPQVVRLVMLRVSKLVLT